MRVQSLLICAVLLASCSNQSEPKVVGSRAAAEKPPVPGCVPIQQKIGLLPGQEPVCIVGELKAVTVVYAQDGFVMLQVDCGCAKSPTP